MATFTATLILGDFCRVGEKILAWLSPPPLLLSLSPLFGLGTRMAIAQGKKVRVFVSFV